MRHLALLLFFSAATCLGQELSLPPDEGTGLSFEEEIPTNTEEEEFPGLLPSEGDVTFRTLGRNPTAEDFDEQAQSPEEKKFLHPFYLYQRTRLSWQDSGRAGWLLLRRDHELAFTPDNLYRHLRKWWVVSEDPFGLDQGVVGHYRLGFGQGLVLAHTLGYETRLIKPREKPLTEDSSTLDNAYLRGLAASGSWESWDLTGFFSHTYLDGSQNLDGSFNEDLETVRDNPGALDSPLALSEDNTLAERLVGFHGRWRTESARLGFTAVESHYSEPVDPQGSVNITNVPNRLSHAFHGKENRILGTDWDYGIGPVNFFGEYAHSHASGGGFSPRDGQSWTTTGIVGKEALKGFLRFYRYDADYFSRHASVYALASEDTPAQNERGILGGAEWKKSGHRIYVSYGRGKTLDSLFSGNSLSTLPPFREDLARLEVDLIYKVHRDWELEFQEIDQWRERFVDLASLTGSPTPDRQQIPQQRFKRRYQMTWEATPEITARLRYEQTNQVFPSVDRSHNASLFFGELKLKLSKTLTLQPRFTVFDSDEALLGEDVFTSQMEPVWYNTYSPQSFGFGQKGTRFYVQLIQKVGHQWLLWLRYGVTSIDERERVVISNSSDRDSAIRSKVQDVRLQIEYRWKTVKSEE